MEFSVRTVGFEEEEPPLPQIPFGISEFSATPPHRDKVTSGRSLGESDRLSVPLSAAPLPTDWGEWDTERCPTSSAQCLGSCSSSLQEGKPHGATCSCCV